MGRSPALLSSRDRRGAAAVELALLLPFLCFAFLASVDFCRVFYYSVAVSNCARNGALYGSADKIHALNTSGIQAAAQADARNLNSQQLSVISSTDSNVNPTRVDVTVTYSFTPITNFPGIPAQTNLRRTVRMSVLPATPNFVAVHELKECDRRAAEVTEKKER
jgi:Flp pilus assembly protein TadG